MTTHFSLRGVAITALAAGGLLLSGCYAAPYGYHRYGYSGYSSYPSYSYGPSYGYGYGYYHHRHHDDDDDD